MCMVAGWPARPTASTQAAPPPTSAQPSSPSKTRRIGWQQRGPRRLLLGPTLFYGKGGVALEDSSTTVNCVYGEPGQSSGGHVPCLIRPGVIIGGLSTPSYTRVGWTLGFGTEFDLGKNWSAKAEYDFLSFGRHTALASDGTTFLTDRSDISQVKLGVNYRFAPGAGGPKY
jgi:opacity protein-like surface antigen